MTKANATRRSMSVFTNWDGDEIFTIVLLKPTEANSKLFTEWASAWNKNPVNVGRAFGCKALAIEAPEKMNISHIRGLAADLHFVEMCTEMNSEGNRIEFLPKEDVDNE